MFIFSAQGFIFLEKRHIFRLFAVCFLIFLRILLKKAMKKLALIHHTC